MTLRDEIQEARSSIGWAIAHNQADDLDLRNIEEHLDTALEILGNSREVTEKKTKPYCTEGSHAVSYLVTNHKARVVLDD